MSSRRGVAIVFTLLALAIVFSMGLVWMFGSMLAGAAPPTVPTQTTLRLTLQAPFSEIEPVEVLPGFLESPLSLRGTIDLIHRAKVDSRIKSLLVLPRTEGAMWAQLQDIRAAIVDFKASGKPVTAFLEYGGAQEYYVASAADRVVMTPAGTLDLTGLTTYEMFFRGALDKIGVYPDMIHIGEYKTASNTFTEKGFTAAHREMTQSLNRDFYDELVRALAEGRRKSEGDMRTIIDNGPFLTADAVKAGLVDAALYDDQLDAEPAHRGTTRLEATAYARNLGTTPGYGSGPSIALLYAVGEITSGKSADGFGGGSIGSDTFVKWVRRVRLDPSIRAVVVRVDSPGGGAIASDVMWRELRLLRDAHKPLIVSMGNVAASGGYYIAAPADVIVAEPGTITGSIGVLSGKFVTKELFDKLGIGTDAVSDGRNAQIDSPLRPFSKEERAKMDEQMHATYDQFVARVAEGRRMKPEQVDAIGRGRVWTGHQAKERGLVDEIGGLDRAIDLAKAKAQIAPTSSVHLVVYPPRRTFFDLIGTPSDDSLSERLGLSLKRPELRAASRALRIAQLFRAGEILTLLPTFLWN